MKKMLVYSSQIEILLVMYIHLLKFEKKKITNKIFVEFENNSHLNLQLIYTTIVIFMLILKTTVCVLFSYEAQFLLLFYE